MTESYRQWLDRVHRDVEPTAAQARGAIRELDRLDARISRVIGAMDAATDEATRRRAAARLDRLECQEDRQRARLEELPADVLIQLIT
jgi:hypothetical protein